MNEGTPDASRWLGLDRFSFVSTACVEQAQMLRVRAEAGGLQQHLQRAAATAGADSTAAAALARIASFRSEHVGLDRANSTKPLRRALGTVKTASEHLAAARRDHETYLQLARQADELSKAARTADAAVTAHEAASAAHQAAQLTRQAERAAELHEELGDTPHRQVILFTQEEQVAAWAREHLSPQPTPCMCYTRLPLDDRYQSDLAAGMGN